MRGFLCKKCFHPITEHTGNYGTTVISVTACTHLFETNNIKMYCSCIEFEPSDIESVEKMTSKEFELEIDQLQRERSLLYFEADEKIAQARALTHEIEELYAKRK